MHLFGFVTKKFVTMHGNMNVIIKYLEIRVDTKIFMKGDIYR
jgi:hypothetical protein